MKKLNIVEVTFQESYPYNDGIFTCLTNEQENGKNGDLEIPIIFQDRVIGAVEKLDVKQSLNKQRILVTYYGWVGFDNLKAYVHLDTVHECLGDVVVDKRVE